MKTRRSTSFYILILLAMALGAVLIFASSSSGKNQVTLSINQVAAGIKDGSITRILVDENTLNITFQDGSFGTAQKEAATDFTEQLHQYGVTADDLNSKNISVEIKAPSQWAGIFSILSYVLPFLLVGGVLLLFFRSARNNSNGAMSFGKSGAKVVNPEKPSVKFEDVAGAEEAREELKEVVDFLKEPAKFVSLGARIPKGVLLVGVPGSGKTLLAKAVAGEASVPFFSISGSEFVELFVGVGASRVRDLFDQAKRHAPSIIFIDEVDAVGRQRGAGFGGSNEEREQTLNQLLVEMDGFGTDTNVIVIAATNRPDVLDHALLRPGRFDRRVILDRPDMRGREAILRIHTRGKPVDPAVDFSKLALAIPGFVGADIENLVNEAAILAARRGKTQIGQSELEESIERVIAGPERKSRLISPEERVIIAYHEAGHAVVMNSLAKADPVHKITIIARGMAGGYTMPRPTEERHLESSKKLMADMISLLGGRTAEELVFNDITSGASNDLERVTQIARAMVTRLGMSEMGPMVYGKKEEMIFLGREISEQKDYSDAVSEQIDRQVRQLVNDAHEKARQILIQYRDKLDAVAKRLLEIETLSQAEFESIFPTPIKKEGSTPSLA
jgi:cell division protease FtsH